MSVKFISVVGFLLAALVVTRAQALDQPTVELAASPATVAVGSPIEITITYRWPPSWQVITPDPGRTFADAYVVASPPPERWQTGEEIGERWRLRVLAQRSGPWELPRPILRGTPPSQKGSVETPATVEAQAPMVVVQVGALAEPAKPAPPRDLWLSDPEPTPVTPWWIAAVVAATATIILGALAWWWPRRQAAADIPPITTLRHSLGLAFSGDGKEAGARISAALRRYAGDIFGFDGRATTARECTARLRTSLMDAEYRDIARLLDELDALRWAADDLAAAAVEPLRARALAWADQVQQRVDREAEAAAAMAKNALKNESKGPGPESTQKGNR